jgi:hypothetical protein
LLHRRFRLTIGRQESAAARPGAGERLRCKTSDLAPVGAAAYEGLSSCRLPAT